MPKRQVFHITILGCYYLFLSVSILSPLVAPLKTFFFFFFFLDFSYSSSSSGGALQQSARSSSGAWQRPTQGGFGDRSDRQRQARDSAWNLLADAKAEWQTRRRRSDGKTVPTGNTLGRGRGSFGW